MFSKISILALAASAAAQVNYGGKASGTVSSAAASQSFACNPAHEYPEGRQCVSTNGGLTLLPPTTTASATATTFACNPAHQYPSGVTCTSISGSLTLVGPSATPSAVTCQDQYNKCRQPTNGVSANQAACAAQNAECEGKCEAAFNTCKIPVNGMSANNAACVAAYAGCLGYNPFAQTSSAASPTGDVYVTQVVTAYTTYCPSATTFAYGNKTYTVSSATTLTITSCPGGCKVTTPIKSLPPATTVTAVVPHYTTECPSPTTVTIQSSTYTVSTATVITVSCPGGCTITTPVSKLPPATTVPVVVASSTVATVKQSASASTSAPAVYTGAAEKVAGSGALALGALGLFFL